MSHIFSPAQLEDGVGPNGETVYRLSVPDVSEIGRTKEVLDKLRAFASQYVTYDLPVRNFLAGECLIQSRSVREIMFCELVSIMLTWASGYAWHREFDEMNEQFDSKWADEVEKYERGRLTRIRPAP